MVTRFKIANGPSMFDVMLSLFKGEMSVFKCTDDEGHGFRLSIVFTSIESLDRRKKEDILNHTSLCRFRFTGYFVHDDLITQGWCRGTFSIKTRKGQIRIA